MLVSPLASSTTPPTVCSGHDPSARCARRTQPHAAATSADRPATSRAIADSTWFHASTCPPTVHGIAPSASCTDAIAAPDAATSARQSTSGDIVVRGVEGLVEVDDQALAEHGVEGALGPLGEARILHDVPGQEPVVR